jgi:hypothetical protein
LELARGCSTPYQTTVIREKDGKEKAYPIRFGFLPVCLVKHSDRPLWLVVGQGVWPGAHDAFDHKAHAS